MSEISELGNYRVNPVASTEFPDNFRKNGEGNEKPFQNQLEDALKGKKFQELVPSLGTEPPAVKLTLSQEGINASNGAGISTETPSPKLTFSPYKR